MGVLDRHCEDVGRDPKEITRTRMAPVLLTETAEEGERLIAGMDERRRAMALAGTPEQIAEGVQALLDAGIEGITVSTPAVHDLDTLRVIGETISPLVGQP
jgi:alkanesulfonate monooxygenase SsuD/methylene tetrahydromethanopterin reductase-like flavin-dependent oxidoreductase (luciferase family)